MKITTFGYAISDPATGGVLVDTVARYARASMIAFLTTGERLKAVPTHLWTDKHVQDAFDVHANTPHGEHEVVRVKIEIEHER